MNESEAIARKPRTPWGDAWRRLRRERLAMICLAVIAGYVLVGIATAMGALAPDHSQTFQGEHYQPISLVEAYGHFGWSGQTFLTGTVLWVLLVPGLYLWLGPRRPFLVGLALGLAGCLGVAGVLHAALSIPSLEGHEGHPFTLHVLGADIFGRNIVSRVLYGVSIALRIGVVTSLIAFPIGLALGAIAGYFGGRVDELIVWFYSTLASIPGLLLVLAIGFALKQVRGIPDIYVIYFAIGTTGWVTLCRLIRGEVLKHKGRDYVAAARALGVSHARVLVRHLLPNVFHVVIIRFSLQFVYAIETEVILSYLGVGIQDPKIPSWGRMIDDSKQELIQGVFGNLTGATIALFGIALAFNIFGDALRDALDPKLRD